MIQGVQPRSRLHMALGGVIEGGPLRFRETKVAFNKKSP